MKKVDIPEGWVAVCEWNQQRGTGGAKGDYATLLSAIAKHEIDYLSAGRPYRYYVQRVEAESYLRDMMEPKKPRDARDSGLMRRIDVMERSINTLARLMSEHVSFPRGRDAADHA